MEDVLTWVAIDVAVGRKLDDPIGGIGDDPESDPEKGAAE